MESKIAPITPIVKSILILLIFALLSFGCDKIDRDYEKEVGFSEIREKND